MLHDVHYVNEMMLVLQGTDFDWQTPVKLIISQPLYQQRLNINSGVMLSLEVLVLSFIELTSLVRLLSISTDIAYLEGKEKFYKESLNSSYGYDEMNTEKFSKINVCDENQARTAIIADCYLG